MQGFDAALDYGVPSTFINYGITFSDGYLA